MFLNCRKDVTVNLKSSIDQLLDFDIAARKVIITCKNEARAINEEAAEKVKKLTAEYEKKTVDEKAANESAYRKKAEARIEAANAQSKNRIQTMEAMFDKNRDVYEKAIITRITEI